MQETLSHPKSTRVLERILAVLGTAICLVVSAGLWLAIHAQQTIWPFPALYLLEMLAASGLGAWCLWNRPAGASGLRGILTWVAIGCQLGFVVLGVFSVGFAYLLPLGLLASATILSDRRLGRSPFLHLGVGLAAALAQAGLMLAVIQILYR